MHSHKRISAHFKRSVIVVTLFLLNHSSPAQKTISERDDQQWVQYVNIIRIPQKWVIHSNTSFRWRDTYNLSTQFHIRSGLGYDFTDKVRFLSGMGFFRPINNSSVIHHEIRPFQELRIAQDLGKSRMINRFQLEERILKRVESEISDPIYLRFRYALFFTFPIANLSSQRRIVKLQLAVRNELFVNGLNSSEEKTFDQDRVTLGPILAMKQFSFLVLWHNQISSLPIQNDYRYTSILVFQILQRLNLK